MTSLCNRSSFAVFCLNAYYLYVEDLLELHIHEGRSLLKYARAAFTKVKLPVIGVILCLPLAGQSGTSFLVRTIAGSYGTATGGLGDGGLALQAQLLFPTAVAVDGFGNVLIADQGNNRIRKVAPSGIITTFAGNGLVGSGGDGGPAVSAQLLGAQTVAVDHTGNVFIGECYGTNPPTSHQLRVVDSSGVINTVATAFACVFSLAVDNSNNLYVLGAVSPGPLQIFKVSPAGTVSLMAGAATTGYSGDGGAAINAEFNQPAEIAYDNLTGILYVADLGNYRVRAIYPNGTIQTVAGTGEPGFSGDGGLGSAAELSYPLGVAVDAASNVYISDFRNSRIRVLTPAGVISTVAGNGVGDRGPAPVLIPGGYYQGNGDGGPAILGAISPGALTIDSKGNVYFAGASPLVNSVRELVPSPSTIGCMYSAVPSQINSPTTGGSSSVNVIAALTSCPWLAFSTTDWIEITGGASGTGGGTVSLTASANPLSASRSALVPIAGQIVTVSQDGTPCTFTLSVQEVSAPAAGASGTVNVNVNLPDCAWSATSNAPWLFVISGASGQGNGMVNYTAAQNNAAARTGTLSIAGQTFTINQAAAPGFPAVSILGSAATGTSPFAAGQLISIYGSSLGPAAGSGLQLGTSGVVTTSNAGTQVLFDGTAAPILYTSAGQVNVVIPCAVAGQSSTQMVVQYMGAQSAPLTMALSPAAPGIFTADGSGQGQAAALNPDNSFNSPSNPAPIGSIVTFYATGVGPTSPCVDGATYQSNFPTLTLPVIVGVGNSGARVLYGGQAPELVSGVAQFNIKIPTVATTGVVPLALEVGGVLSPPGVTIAVK
jgi:uncharacterized protein (TIGR03437 family)